MIEKHIMLDNPNATTFCCEVARDWMSYYDDAMYLGCENNKIGDTVVALYHNNTIYLLGDVYKTIMYAPKILFHKVDENHIHIDDVLMKHNDVGNGGIAMRALFKYAKKNGVKKITGSLSKVDDDHRSRRDHYYKKFGFDVSEFQIIKNL